MQRRARLWPNGRRFRVTFPLFVAALGGAAACSSLANVERRTLPDGSHELTCRAELSKCLVQIQETCAEAGYDVVGAYEERKRVGPGTIATEIVRSHATVRCRRAAAVFGDSDAPGAPPPAGATPAPPATAVCSPGATQVCVGTGACQGGQSCLPDGSGFGPCDCGPAPASEIPAENPAPPATTAAPSAAPPPVPAPAGSASPAPAP